MPVILAALFLLLCLSPTWAEDKPKGPTCQSQLNEVSVLSHNIGVDRSQKELALAKEQVKVFTLEQQVSALKKQVEELSKPKEMPAP